MELLLLLLPLLLLPVMITAVSTAAVVLHCRLTAITATNG
jgi:hypothetical protein